MSTIDDRTAIIDTLQRYCVRIDELDFAGVAAVFTTDADVEYGAYPPLTGGAAVGEFLAARCAGIAWHQHMAQPVEIEIDGDRARATTYFTAHAVEASDPDRVCLTVGQYRDRLQRTPDGWLICERRQRTGWRDYRTRG
jgi:hypothetical protein